MEPEPEPLQALQPIQPIQPTQHSEPAQQRIIPDQFMHKNRLQEYAQKSALLLPSYHTINEGYPHEPKFRSTVLFDGVSYTSQAFRHRREAEQNAAKIALDSILKKIKDEGCPLIHEDMTFCKSILNEFAVKLSLELPTYTTNRTEGIIPLFTSTLVFQGKTYVGNTGKNKKEAEQMAARNVIQIFLGTESRSVLSEIINTKRRLYNVLRQARENNVLPIVPSSQNVAEVQNEPEADADIQPMKKPKIESETRTDPIGNVTPVQDQPPCADNGVTVSVERTSASTSGTKHPRKKNKKKGQHGILTDGRQQLAVIPMIQAASCSVAL